MKLPLKIEWTAAEFDRFSPLIRDYLRRKEETAEFYELFPGEKELLLQAGKKLKHYTHREITADALDRQMAFAELSPKQVENLKRFRDKNSVTVTTGHQLNLMTGPVYILYKISQVIRCCEYMNSRHSDYYFIPIFWMATEDHDFEEINHFYYRDYKFSWEREFGGPVGRMKLDGINKVFDEFFKILPGSGYADEVKEMVRKSYLDSSTLTEATQKLVQMLFGDTGLLMIDGDDLELKKLMIPAFEEDLIDHTAFHKIEATSQRMRAKEYKVKANPREINLFYLLGDDIRERIVEEDGVYKVLETDLQFSREEILEELHTHPDRFSPNVILRPLFQEIILPNISYVGGMGESAYWLELKDFFESQEIPFPIITVRSSMLLITEKQRHRLEKLDVSYKSLLIPEDKLIKANVMAHSNTDIDFEGYREQLEEMFNELDAKAVQTDVTFSKMVAAERTRQLKGLDRMIKRLERAEKRKQEERVEKLKAIRKELFPLDKLQERVENYSAFWTLYGNRLTKQFCKEVHPINFRFIIKSIS